MIELVAAFGLALAIEGLLFASFPNAMRKAMMDAAASPTERVRVVGLVSAVVGVVVVWIARRLFG